MRIQAQETPLDAYTDLGGYPIVYYAADWETICARCANNPGRGDHFHTGCQSDEHRGECVDEDPEWCLIASDIHWEGAPAICVNCNAQIESAYGDPDEGKE